jgi:hypothetical protein
MPFCPNCGKEGGEDIKFCPQCGQNLKVEVTPENTSGQGESAAVPEEVKGWSWGGFILTWIWGVCNGVLISLLCLIPVFGIVWAFVLGAKGKEWSWRYKKWDNVEHFKNTHRPWDIAGIVLFAISMVALIAVIPTVLFPIFLWW